MNAMNFLMNRFIGFGFKRTTTVVATTVVATTLMYKAYRAHNKRKALQNQDKNKEPPVEPFENKYFKEYDELADDPHAPVPPAHSHVRETTPQGDVIMTYDTNRAVFCYYCDKRSVQFKYLEPVARKYVVVHGCKRLYIDFREELSKAKDKAAAVIAAAATAAAATVAAAAAAPSTTAAAKPTSIFAQLKKYSNATAKHPLNKNNNNNNSNNNNNNNKGLNVNANANANEDRVCVLKEQVTRYLYCGRLDNFVAISETEETNHANESHDFNIIKPIDYASYKKMNDA